MIDESGNGAGFDVVGMTALEEIKKALEEYDKKEIEGYGKSYTVTNDLHDLLTVVNVRGIITTLEALQRENIKLKAEIERTERNRDMWKGQVERQAKQIEDFRSETKRLQVGVHVETLPRAHLIRVFAEDMNERNWDDKRLYIKQQAERITAALASAGEHHADK